ncbi:PREDICTED: uncharacterized protein LOC108781842 isoform X2 [Cyphomyrmex costatus]|uniref:uncharacterized protein LOC108781842 isoform X2 n=1 Tax=Cyphomyrmex costatus TaxID=456900 RepID=UPI0008523AC8|nr:PREDICTED: uncharacterized protein LOC108781842 isoform X2 [Cyphomyrmex costatus]
MKGTMEIFTSLVLLIVELTLEDVVNTHNRDTVVTSSDILNFKDPCNLCENTVTGFPNSYIKSCCQRGCRFFNLINSRYKWEEDRLNGTIRNACEAYLLPLFTIATCMENNIDILPTPPDIPENDILTDPGLRKELLPRWWDVDGFKLPQTHIKTIPIDARTVDYTQASDCSEETKQLSSTYKSETFQQAKNILSHIGHLYLKYIAALAGPFIAIVGPAISLYYIKKKHRSYKKKFYSNINFSKNIMVFMPNELVMYTILPPEHHKELSSRSI